MPARSRRPHQGRRDHLRRVEPRSNHRRLSLSRAASGLPHKTWTGPQGPAGLPAAQRKLLITTASSAWTVIRAAPRCARWPRLRLHHDGRRCPCQRVFGRNGRGTVDHFGMHGRVDIQVARSRRHRRLGATSRAAVVVEFLYHRARPSCFPRRILRRSPPVHCRARRAARGAQLIDQLWRNTGSSSGLVALGFDTGIRRAHHR